jgi:hypothetical protein
VFFWDVNPDTFEPEAYPEYAIARVLELGDVEAVRWMKAHFDEETIEKVIRSDRRLTPRSANYWALIYQIPAHDVAALR